MLGPIDLWSWTDGAAAVHVRPRVTDESGPAVRCTDVTDEGTDPMTTRIDGQTVTLKPIHPNNAHIARVHLEQFDDDANDYVDWEDAEDVEVALCTDRQGDEVISGCGPFTMSAVSAENAPGYFRYIFPAAVTTLLDTDALRGRVIFQRVTAGANAELKSTQPLVVTEPRFAA